MGVSPPIALVSIGPPELLVIGAVALALFGRRLPRLLGSLWRTMTFFRQGVDDAQDQLRRELLGSLDPSSPPARRRPPQRPPRPRRTGRSRTPSSS